MLAALAIASAWHCPRSPPLRSHARRRLRRPHLETISIDLPGGAPRRRGRGRGPAGPARPLGRSSNRRAWDRVVPAPRRGRLPGRPLRHARLRRVHDRGRRVPAARRRRGGPGPLRHRPGRHRAATRWARGSPSTPSSSRRTDPSPTSGSAAASAASTAAHAPRSGALRGRGRRRGCRGLGPRGRARHPHLGRRLDRRRQPAADRVDPAVRASIKAMDRELLEPGRVYGSFERPDPPAIERLERDRAADARRHRRAGHDGTRAAAEIVAERVPGARIERLAERRAHRRDGGPRDSSRR